MLLKHNLESPRGKGKFIVITHSFTFSVVVLSILMASGSFLLQKLPLGPIW